MFPVSIAAWLARSALMQSPIGGLLKRIPARAWLYLAVALAMAAAFVWHGHAVRSAIAAAEKRGADAYAAKLEARARRVEHEAVETSGKISTQIKDKHNVEIGRIHGTAAAVGVRGPGAAVCRDPAVSAAAGRPRPTAQGGDVAVPRLPYPDGAALLAMPWNEAVAYGEQHDLNLAEVKAWREWYRQQYAAWEKLRASSARPSK